MNSDPFAVDESQFVSLSPEQRAALKIRFLRSSKNRPNLMLQKERDSESKKYTDHVKKSPSPGEISGSDPEFVEVVSGPPGSSTDGSEDGGLCRRMGQSLRSVVWRGPWSA